MRREPPKTRAARYVLDMVVGPFATRDNAMAFGSLWQHRLRSLEPRRLRGYELAVHFSRTAWGTSSAAEEAVGDEGGD